MSDELVTMCVCGHVAEWHYRLMRASFKKSEVWTIGFVSARRANAGPTKCPSRTCRCPQVIYTDQTMTLRAVHARHKRP